MLLFSGIFLVIVGQIGLNTPTNCPEGGCSASALWHIYGAYYIAFYFGIALAIGGVSLLVGSWFVKVKQDRVSPEWSPEDRRDIQVGKTEIFSYERHMIRIDAVKTQIQKLELG